AAVGKMSGRVADKDSVGVNLSQRSERVHEVDIAGGSKPMEAQTSVGGVVIDGEEIGIEVIPRTVLLIAQVICDGEELVSVEGVGVAALLLHGSGRAGMREN